ncbi:Uncharacterised protein [Vibrio cholerae]|nr:Uncharacterised protein [Vibrio cholerae]CSB80203.1 Uncharacterised protein [Vibrio cholerae]
MTTWDTHHGFYLRQLAGRRLCRIQAIRQLNQNFNAIDIVNIDDLLANLNTFKLLSADTRDDAIHWCA